MKGTLDKQIEGKEGGVTDPFEDKLGQAMYVAPGQRYIHGYVVTLALAEYCYLYGVKGHSIMVWLNMRFLRLNLDILGVMTTLLTKWSAGYVFTQLRSFLCFVRTIYSMS